MFGSSAAWGIDLGHSAVKAVRMARRGNALVIQAFELVDLSKVSVEGKATREERLRAAINILIKKYGLRSEKIWLSIPAKSGVLSKFIQLPPVDRKKIPEMVKFEARQQIPFDLKEVIYDYQPLRKEFAPGEAVEVGLFAARRDLVDGALKHFESAKKRVAGVQISPLATYNFVRYDQKIKGAIGIIDIGAENTDLIIITDKGFWLRSLHVAGNSINRILMEKFNVTFEEAESIKQRIAESKYRKQIMEVIQPTYRDLTMEIDRSLGYYKSLSKDVKIERLLLVGGGIRVAGLEKFLAENLHYSFQKLTDLHTIGLSGNVNKAAFLEALPLLGVAIGLAIQGLNAGDVTINLLPPEFVFEQEIERKKPWAIAAAVCLAAVMGLWYQEEKNVHDQLAPELAKLEDPATSILAKAEKLDKQYAAAEKAVSYERLNFLTRVPHQQGVPRDLWLKLIQHVSDVVPEGVYLREIHSEIGVPEEVEARLRTAGEGPVGEASLAEGQILGTEGGPPVPGPMVPPVAPGVSPMPGAPPTPGVPGGPEAAPDISKQRLNIVITIETEYTKERGLEFIRLKFLAPLENISLREDGKPLFKSVEMLNSREELRNRAGEVIKATDLEKISAAGEGERATGFEAERLRRLKAERVRYLIVPIWCVVNSDEDYKTLPDADSVDKTIAEIKGAEHDDLPQLTTLVQEAAGPAIVQIANNMTDTSILAYFSGQKLRVARVYPKDRWHVILDPGTYQVAIRPEKEGIKPAYGEQKYAPGGAYSMEFPGSGLPGK